MCHMYKSGDDTQLIGMRTRSVSPDSATFCTACACVDDTMRKMQTLGVKTYNGNPKRDPRLNPFSTLKSDDEDDDEDVRKREDDERGADDDIVDYEEKHGKFEEVVRRRKTETSHIGAHRIYSKEECAIFSEMYNLWFKCYTGKDLDFVISPASQPFVSAFEACMVRDYLLATLFDERPTWVDPFGGSGSDSAAALFNLYPKAVYMTEYTHGSKPGDKVEDFGDMKRNIDKMCMLFDELNPAKNPAAPKVHMFNKESEHFLRDLPLDIIIDILYIDPNWYMGGPLGETERSPQQMMTYLNYHVIKPLKERGTLPKCIVFKTRWLTDVLIHFVKLLTDDYHPMYSIEATPYRTKIDEKKFEEEGEVRGRFHWAVIVHNELKTVHWKKSDVYTKLFTDREDVYIDEEDLIRPRRPAYAGFMPFPKQSSRTSGGGLIHVHPPQREKGVYAKKTGRMSRFKAATRKVVRGQGRT